MPFEKTSKIDTEPGRRCILAWVVRDDPSTVAYVGLDSRPAVSRSFATWGETLAWVERVAEALGFGVLWVGRI